MNELVEVQLICKVEGKVLGVIETTGPLTAQVIQRGLRVQDRKRCPQVKEIQDGVQLACGRCQEPLYFRANNGQPFPAMPASVEAQA